MHVRELRKSIVDIALKMEKANLIFRTFGNISARIDENTFLITPSGRNYSDMKPEDIVEVDMRSDSYTGKFKPSSEYRIHKGIYLNRPGINFVIHTHQPYASAISVLQKDRIDFEDDAEKSSIIISGYGLPGTHKLYKKTIKGVLQCDSNYLIMKNHGALCYGKDSNEAMCNAIKLENFSFNFLKRSLGEKYINLINSIDISPQTGRDTAELFGVKDCYIYGIPLKFTENKDIIKTIIKPYLDDFAQIVGLKSHRYIKAESSKDIRSVFKKNKIIIIRNEGIFTCSRNCDDAIYQLKALEKNILASLLSYIYGEEKPISLKNIFLMHRKYTKNYSKLNKN